MYCYIISENFIAGYILYVNNLDFYYYAYIDLVLVAKENYRCFSIDYRVSGEGAGWLAYVVVQAAGVALDTSFAATIIPDSSESPLQLTSL